MIQVENLTKDFGINRAVSELSFHVGAGEIVGLLGENGAGKTTAFRIISGLMKPSAGSCHVCGIDVRADTMGSRLHTGFLPGSDPGLYGRLTAMENIMYYARLYGMSDDDAARRAMQLAEALDMLNFMYRRAGAFSRGMKQRTAIARAFIHDPEVMLLDEPSTGLDAGSVLAINSLIRESRDSGRAILISSHNVHEVRRLCDRVIILHRGRLMEAGTPSCLEEKYGMDFESVFLKLMGYIN